MAASKCADATTRRGIVTAAAKLIDMVAAKKKKKMAGLPPTVKLVAAGASAYICKTFGTVGQQSEQTAVHGHSVKKVNYLFMTRGE